MNKRYFYIILAAICIILLSIPHRTGQSGMKRLNSFRQKHVRCALITENKYIDFNTDFNYSILQSFASESNCEIDIHIQQKNEDYLDSLKDGKVDLIISIDSDSLCLHCFNKSVDIGNNYVFLTSVGQDVEMSEIDFWLREFKLTSTYRSKVENFSKRIYNPYTYEENGIRIKSLSPYDELIRSHSVHLGWDWRLLAAVIYQESKFSIGQQSHRGATGLMQVMPRTGKYYKIYDLINPDNNITAGCLHLKRLQNMFAKEIEDTSELINFTLAAYNAGEGRIQKCQAFARQRGINPHIWKNIVMAIDEMDDFHGEETINYVNNVRHLHEIFKQICPTNK